MTILADESARLLHWMPMVVASAGLSDWERQFCASMIVRARDPRFVPTRKQMGAMHRLVARFQAETLRDDAPAGPTARPRESSSSQDGSTVPQTAEAAQRPDLSRYPVTSWPYDAGHTEPRGREEWPGGIGE